MKRTTEIHKEAVAVKRSKTGLGLFAKQTLTPGMFIEYKGDIITNKEADSMNGARYLFEINSRWTINGAQRDNLARYINHSCEPNCESVQNGKRIFIKVITPIHVGEELTYDYGEEYFNEFIKPFGCKCNACLQ
jgi:SET domain-containing protein